MPSPSPFESFILLSVQLCGVTSFDLLGTGYAERFFETVQNRVGGDVLESLLKAYRALPTDPEKRNGDFETALLKDPAHGSICRSITKLWYTATWYDPFPPSGNGSTAAAPQAFVPYPYAYRESLLGPAVGAHPAGAKPTGHQSWTEPPVYLPIPRECA